jgi:hypothetical protein
MANAIKHRSGNDAVNFHAPTPKIFSDFWELCHSTNINESDKGYTSAGYYKITVILSLAYPIRMDFIA